MADIFISYKREDKQIAERLSIALEQLGFDVWWDLNLISGQPYRAAIRAVIDQCKAAIVLWSEKSVLSDFVMDEASYAHRLGKLCPARIDGVDLPMGFGQTHTADLVGWDGETSHKGFQNVVSAVEARVGRKGRLGASARTPEADAKAAELEGFKTAQFAGTSQALKAFLKHFPRGAFAGFVRGQLESMEADARHAATANTTTTYAPPPREPPRPTPVYHAPPPPPRAPAFPTVDTTPEKKSPWPMLAGGALAVATFALAIAFWPRDNDSNPNVQGQPAVTETRDVDAEIEAARQAERERVQQEYAAQQAQQQRDADAREQNNRDQTALQTQAARNQADDNAWTVAQRANTAAGYDAYLYAYGSGRHASEARSARTRLQAAASTTATYGAYDLAQLHPQVRAAAAEARRARTTAENAAAQARNGVSGLVRTVNNGNAEGTSRMEGQELSANSIGYSVDTVTSGPRLGDQYLGQRNATSQNGYGVYAWAGGVRYEGAWVNGQMSGYGVKWGSSGQVLEAGVWTANTLTTPLSR